MWNEGVEMHDGYMEEIFQLRAINDFPAYSNLSGYSIKGKCAWPICEDNTDWVRLEHGKKNVFLGHRRFLPSQHRYRGWRKSFNGRIEERRPLELLFGDKVYHKVKDINKKFGKTFAMNLVTRGWKKKSIFFELPYWKSLYIRHFLDVMYIEKKIDSVIGTLLNVPGKSKGGISSRLDLLDMGIRIELAPIKKGKHQYLPLAAHTLSRKEKIVFCKFCKELKFQKGTHQTSEA